MIRKYLKSYLDKEMFVNNNKGAMQLQTLELENFRNFESLKLDFSSSKRVTVLIGENAQGKTNLLESIYFLALTKSYRTNHFTETITWDRDHGRIKGRIQDDDTIDLEITFDSQKRKKYRKEDVIVDNKKYIRNLTVVLFVPGDIHIVTGEPAKRRRYLNLIALQAFPNYLETLATYTKALKSRNELLKKRAPRTEIEIWDEKLAQYGLEIWEKRTQILDFFQERISQKYQQLSAGDARITIKTEPKPETREEYLDHMTARFEQDTARQATSFGPHRDDFSVLIDGKLIKKFGSRGEGRTAVLALKLTELELLTQLTGRKPVLLLDDVLSELDHSRQKHLIKVILDHQTILTTTCREHLAGFTDEIEVLKVEDGGIA